MKPQKKGELIGSIIGLLCIYMVLGTIYHFVLGHDLLSTVRLLAIQTILLLIVGILITAVIWLLFFVFSKIKR
jgi:hypothetical protein